MSTYLVAVFLSSFLVFLVQPLVGKYILPWFGGSPGVWTTCLLFFQLMLVAGYNYAHVITTRLQRSQQVIVHLMVLGISLLFLPMIPSGEWRSIAEDSPAMTILWLLTVTVGPRIFSWLLPRHCCKVGSACRFQTVRPIASMPSQTLLRWALCYLTRYCGKEFFICVSNAGSGRYYIWFLHYR